MSEGEKIQFNGNLALLRVCAIVFIVNLLNIVVNMSIMAVRGGVFNSLWSALTTSSFEDLLATVGLMIASGVGLGVLLGILAFAVLFALGIIALVKKNVKALKILAVLFLVWMVLGAFAMNPISGLLGNEMREVNLAQSFINLFFNVNVVVAVAAFFVASKKQDESESAANEEFNLGLLRLCAICFSVIGVNSLSHFIFMQPPVFQLAFFGVVDLAIGVFALVKKNVPVLMVGSLMVLVKIFWSVMQIIHIDGWSFYMLSIMLIHSLLNVMTVISVAVFFIEPERTRCYLQKAKQKSL
jgi:hypothetical protein